MSENIKENNEEIQKDSFNHNSRTKNVALTSSIGVICTLVNTLLGFGYRTFFIKVLSSQYLGISGLFSNILELLSLANLGIMTSISFRMYKPIAEGDSEKVGQLMRFTRYIYYGVAAFIFVAGSALMPFLPSFIKDMSEVPSDVNIYVAYFFYLLQMVSSYLYTYKLNILIADQKKYEHSIIQCILNLGKYISQIVVLSITRDFTLTLIVGIVATILLNVVFSVMVKKQYNEVFSVKTSLSKEEKKEIFHDSFATLCHKVGATVVNSTDSLCVTKFIGLASTGIYSNYVLITSSLQKILEPILSNVTASIGNAHFTMDADYHYTTYKRLLFMDFFISGFCTFCLYMLINDFMYIWLGDNMSFDALTVAVLCIQFYSQEARCIDDSYISGSGLFVKDKIRPLIEAGLNIVISIVLALRIGLAGVFIGTVISYGLTAFWRQPYLLYKNEFKGKKLSEYWLMYASHACITLTLCIVASYIPFHPDNFFVWALMAVAYGALYVVINALVFGRTEEWKFFENFAKRKLTSRTG